MDGKLTSILNTFIREDDIYKVKFKSGRELLCTSDHPLLMLNPDSFDLSWQNTKHLNNGDYISVYSGSSWRNDVVLPKYENFIGRHNITIPTTVTNELSRVLGYLLSEGSTVSDCVIDFSNTNYKIFNDYVNCFTYVFNIEPVIYLSYLDNGKILYKATVSSLDARIFLDLIGLGFNYSCEKEIPWCILQGSKTSFLHFLASFIDGDGSIYPDIIRVGTCSEKMMLQFQCLFSKLGIFSTVKKHDKYYDYHKNELDSPRSIYMLTIGRKGKDKLCSILPELQDFNKNDKRFVTKFDNTESVYYDKLPGLNIILQKLIKEEINRRKTKKYIFKPVLFNNDVSTLDLIPYFYNENVKVQKGKETTHVLGILKLIGLNPSYKDKIKGKRGKPINFYSKDVITKAFAEDLEYCDDCGVYTSSLYHHNRNKHKITTIQNNATKSITDNYCYYDTFKRYPELYNLLDNDKKSIINLNFIYDQIDTIDYYKKGTVVDFTTEASHFIANGIVTHNCKHGVIAVETALQEYGKPGKLQDALKNVRLEAPPKVTPQKPQKKIKKLLPDSTLQKLNRDLNKAYELDDFAAFDRLRRAIDRIKKNPKFDKVTEISQEMGKKLPVKPTREEERLVPEDQLDKARSELNIIERSLQDSEGKPPISKSVIDRLTRDLQKSEKTDDFAAFDRLRRAIDRIKKNPRFNNISENIRKLPPTKKREKTHLVPKNQLERLKRELSVIENINEKDTK